MRILMVNKFHYPKGGSEAYCFSLAKALEELGHEVAWFSMDHPENLPSEQARYFVSRRDYSRATSLPKQLSDGLSLIYSFEAREKFDRLCRDFAPDIIHLNLVHRQLTFSILDAPAAQGIPVVYTAHDYVLVCPAYTMLDGAGSVCGACLGGSFGNCIRRRCIKGSAAKSALAAAEAVFLKRHGSYRKIDRVIAPSAFMRSKLAEGGFPEDKLLVLGNYIEADGSGDILPADAREKRFLFAGRLTREKGLDVLIEAFSRASDRLAGEWELLIAGDGPEQERLRSLAQDSPAGPSIRFAGKLGAAELGRLMRRSAYSVLPSIWYENCPYALLESLACGTPAIASDNGGIPELIEDGRTGLLATPGDAESLADALIGASSLDAAARDGMQRACAQAAAAHSKDRYLEELLALYRELVAGRGECRA